MGLGEAVGCQTRRHEKVLIGSQGTYLTCLGGTKNHEVRIIMVNFFVGELTNAYKMDCVYLLGDGNIR